MTSSSGTFESRESKKRGSSFKIPSSILLQVLEGVVAATDMSEQDAAVVAEFISSIRLPDIHSGDPNVPLTLSFLDWTAAIYFNIMDTEGEDDMRRLAYLVLAIALLREASRATDGKVVDDDLEIAWDLIQSVLTDRLLTRPRFNISRSPQGSLVVPLYTLTKDGNVDEVFQLEVWLPNEQKEIEDNTVHAYQACAWSWALAGEGTAYRYAVEPVADPPLATHAEYVQTCNDGKNIVTSQMIHPTSSVISNTRKLICATSTHSAVHSRDMSWSIPAGTFHRTEVSADILYAKLSFLTCRHGFGEDASLLGPRDGESFTLSHDFANMRPVALATVVKTVRRWEESMEGGKRSAEHGALSQALLSFNSALYLCQHGDMPNASYYEQLVRSNIDATNRRLGR